MSGEETTMLYLNLTNEGLAISDVLVAFLLIGGFAIAVIIFLAICEWRM